MTKRFALCAILVACGGTTKSTSGPKAEPGKLEVSASLLIPVDENALEPLVCWDAAQRKVRAGDACLELITPGTGVRFDDGASAIVVRHSPANAATCGVKEIAEVNGGQGAAFAVWPDNATLGIQRIPDTDMRTVDATEKAALDGIAHAAAPGGTQPLVVFQAVVMDVDGDGTPDHLYSVGQDADKGMATRFAFSALIYASGTAPGRYVVLEKSAEKAWKLDSTLDIDHDGRSELWLTTEMYDGDKDAGGGNLIAHIVPAGPAGGEPKLDAIGEISCYR